MAHEQYLHVAKVLKNPQNSKMILFYHLFFAGKPGLEKVDDSDYDSGFEWREEVIGTKAKGAQRGNYQRREELAKVEGGGKYWFYAQNPRI